MLEGCSKLIKRLAGEFRVSALEMDNVIPAVSIFGFFSLPIYYFINRYFLVEPSANGAEISLRVLGSLLYAFLILKKHWPTHLLVYFSAIWFTALLVYMPVFCTFMVFKNHFSAAWTLNAISGLILMMLILNHILYAILLVVGIMIGILVYYWSMPHPFPFALDPRPLTVLDIVNTASISLIMGIMFSRKKGMLERAKLEAMRVLGFSLAHELRTPLASIRSGIDGINRYLPTLFDVYDLAKKQGVSIPEIPMDHYSILSKLSSTLLEEITLSNTMIDMMLSKIHPNLPVPQCYPCSIRTCVQNALKRYPFSEHEGKLIHLNIAQDFIFEGEKLFFVHMLFNLLKNALLSIHSTGRGEIYMWTQLGSEENSLYFKDTAQGISPDLEHTIFRPFYSYTHNGVGLGLAFCQSVMDQFKGRITYQNEYGAYLQFGLHFKVLQSFQ